MAASFYRIKSIDSTMNLASDFLRLGKQEFETKYNLPSEPPSSTTQPIVFLASEQSAGKGRQEHSWFSSSGKGIYVTYLYTDWNENTTRPFGLEGLSLAIGLAVAKTLDAFGLHARLKWPNDVLHLYEGDFHKISGVLVDVCTQGNLTSVSIGIGMNVFTQSFPEDLKAVSLEQLLAKEPDYDLVFSRLTEEVIASVQVFKNEGFSAFIADWASRALYLSDKVLVKAGENWLEAEVLGITTIGSLKVRFIESQAEVELFSEDRIDWYGRNK